VAEGAVSDADLGFRSRELARRTPGTLADVRRVDVAVGMLAARHHCDVNAARARLEQVASQAGVSVVQAAAVVITAGRD
jgi:AmiR/NasT family two-component response regulator